MMRVDRTIEGQRWFAVRGRHMDAGTCNVCTVRVERLQRALGKASCPAVEP